MEQNKFKQIWGELYQNKGAVAGLIICFAFIFSAALGPLVSPFSPSELTDQLRLSPFWSETARTLHLLGTDDMGRDTLTRLLHGARLSLLIGFLVVLVSAGSGTILGLISGYYGGKTDKLIMRAMDVLMALPSILLAIVIVSILGPGLINAILAVGIVAIPSFTRI